jgi:hypothetical protein
MQAVRRCASTTDVSFRNTSLLHERRKPRLTFPWVPIVVLAPVQWERNRADAGLPIG